jgi:molybdenum-dependent DNA-binding transcriptional regulator ModE
VAQLLDGVEIATYASISAAAKAIGVPRNRMWEHVGKEESYQGYIWKFKD